MTRPSKQFSSPIQRRFNEHHARIFNALARRLGGLTRLNLCLALAKFGEIPLAVHLKRAAELLDEADLRTFLKSLGSVVRNGGPSDNLFQKHTRILFCAWDGWELFDGRIWAQFRELPALKRWTQPAARSFLASAAAEPGLSLKTYQKRIERLGLKHEGPALVTEAGGILLREFHVTFSPAGVEWLRQHTAKEWLRRHKLQKFVGSGD